jgi:molybdate transport system substrate-binding protein
MAVVAAIGVLAPRRAQAVEAGELVIFAAASLRDGFQALIARFEQRHPGVKVRVGFAGSQELRLQIEHGAEVDVFAAADPSSMAVLREAGLVTPPRIFAYNQLALIASRANACGLETLQDLPRAGRIVLGTPEAPIGAYSERMLANAERAYGEGFRDRVHAHVVSRELNVRQVMAKVLVGEADAGIVYRSDTVGIRDRVVNLSIPPEVNVAAAYPVALLTRARHADLGRAWIELLTSPEGGQTLAAAGFQPATQRAKAAP